MELEVPEPLLFKMSENSDNEDSSQSPKILFHIYCKKNLYSADTSNKRTRTPKKCLKW